MIGLDVVTRPGDWFGCDALVHTDLYIQNRVDRAWVGVTKSQGPRLIRPHPKRPHRSDKKNSPGNTQTRQTKSEWARPTRRFPQSPHSFYYCSRDGFDVTRPGDWFGCDAFRHTDLIKKTRQQYSNSSDKVRGGVTDPEASLITPLLL